MGDVMSDERIERMSRELDSQINGGYNKGETSTKPPYYAIPAGCSDIGDVVCHLPFWIANSIKYLYRLDGKDTPISNLKKARECIDREIQRRTK